MKSIDDIIQQIKDGTLREGVLLIRIFPSPFSAQMTCKGQVD